MRPSLQQAKRRLRIGVNTGIVQGPYGGSNQFVRNLVSGCEKAGHYVSSNLEPHLDVLIVVINHHASRVTFDVNDIRAYKRCYPNTVVIQRINASDEQRGGNLGQNNCILEMNTVADHTVFVSKFMQDFWAKKGISDTDNQTVILTGADRKFFFPRNEKTWDSVKPLKLITHHWSSNFLKGFDIYERLDEMLGLPKWKERYEFTFLGNIPAGFTLNNSKHLPPQSDLQLAETIREHHGYVTASRFEPGGNHYIEAMQCGLPVLHLNHGSLPEYCEQYGVTFSLSDFEEKLEKFRKEYPNLRDNVLHCSYSAQKMSNEYVQLIEHLASGAEKKTTILLRLQFLTYRIIKRITNLRRRVGYKIAK